MTSIREKAQRLIEDLPDNATWEDLMREIYVHKAIEAGLADSDEGRTIPVERCGNDSALKSDCSLD